MLWGSLGLIVGLFLILAATRQWRKNEDTLRTEIMHLRPDRQEQGRERQRDDEGGRPSVRPSVRVKDIIAKSSAVDADATLRLFEEL